MRPTGAHPVYWRTFTQCKPDGWVLRSFQDLANNFKGKLPDDLSSVATPESFPYLLVEGFEKSEWSYTCNTELPQVIETDSVIVADGSRSGLALRGQAGVLGSTLLCYQPKEGINPDFLFYLLQSFYAFTNTATIGGAVPHLDTRLLNKLQLHIPELTEEQALIGIILKFTDDALAVTEAKLTAARRLKTALMQQLFTQGIPGRHTLFKPTRIGEIPEGWEIVTIKSVLDGMPFNGVSPQSREEPPGTPILNVACVNDGICSLKNMTFVDVNEKTVEFCRARAGDFYVLRGNGNREYVARGGLLKEEPEEPTIFSDKLIRLRFQPGKVVERYVPYLWQSQEFLHRIQSKAESGSGLWMISKRDIRRELFALPESMDEQREIVSLIDSSIESIAAIESETVALQRLKRSLLQNFLTGKVRVKPLDVAS